MKKVLFLLYFITATFHGLMAQYPLTSVTEGYFKDFLEWPMAVELSGNESYDKQLKIAVEKHWSDKKIVFMTKEEIGKLTSESGYSVLGFMEVSYVGIVDKKGIAIYIPGVDVNISRLKNVISWVSISCSYSVKKSSRNDDFCQRDCDYPAAIEYKINYIIKELRNVVDFMQEIKYIPTAALFEGSRRYEKIFNEKKKKEKKEYLQKKMLLINETDLNERFKVKDIKKVYDNKYKIVSDNEFKKIVNTKDPQYLALFVSYSPWAELSVFDLEEQKTICINLNRFWGSIHREVVVKKQFKRIQNHRPGRYRRAAILLILAAGVLFMYSKGY